MEHATGSGGKMMVSHIISLSSASTRILPSLPSLIIVQHHGLIIGPYNEPIGKLLYRDPKSTFTIDRIA